MAPTIKKWYTHKTSGFKTSGFKTSGFKTSGFKTSETSGFQNVRSSKRPVAKNSVLVVGGNPQVLLPPCLQAK
jgi:hypothetical protein